MDSFKIVKFPQSILRKRALPVENISSKQREILDRMAQTMYEHNGVGLAAEQVNMDTRMIVVDARDKYGLLKLINPVIIEKEGIEYMEEGCLSLPGIIVNVPRARKILMRTMDQRGQNLTYKLEGLVARAIQHEIDHLNGKIIIDYLNFIKKLIVLFRYYLKRIVKK